MLETTNKRICLLISLHYNYVMLVLLASQILNKWLAYSTH